MHEHGPTAQKCDRTCFITLHLLLVHSNVHNAYMNYIFEKCDAERKKNKHFSSINNAEHIWHNDLIALFYRKLINVCALFDS